MYRETDMSEEQAVGYGDDDQIPIGDGINAGDNGDVLEAPTPKWLNDDCWRVVLDYVPVKDIVRSERVCRRWQGVVHRYLQEVGVCLVSSIKDKFEHQDATILKLKPKNRKAIKEFHGDSVVQFLDKWGECMVYSYCPGCREIFKRIARNCPNLNGMSIEMDNFEKGDIPQELVEFVEKLERIAFLDSTCHDDVGDSLWEDPDQRRSVAWYRDDEHVLSAFWRNFRPINLKSLTFRGPINFLNFFSTDVCYPKLTELILHGDTKNAHLLLGRIPNLERLCLIEFATDDYWTPNDRDKVLEGLQGLKQFVVWQSTIEDNWPKDVLTCCRRLQSLDVRCTDISAVLDELCQSHGLPFTDIRLIDIHTLSDDALAALISSCRNLKSLDVRLCDRLSDAFLKKVASAAHGRLGTLRVHIGGYEGAKYNSLVKAKASYSQLLVDIEPPPENAHNYFESMRIREYIWGEEDQRLSRNRSIKLIN